MEALHSAAAMYCKRYNQKGFTLIELMVVVGILGILISITTANYEAISAKAKTSEAKLALASLYVFQQSYYTEVGTYSGCVTHIGYSAEGARRWYTVGFQAMNALAACGSTGDQL